MVSIGPKTTSPRVRRDPSYVIQGMKSDACVVLSSGIVPVPVQAGLTNANPTDTLAWFMLGEPVRVRFGT